jgi:hypothetical protein
MFSFRPKALDAIDVVTAFGSNFSLRNFRYRINFDLNIISHTILYIIKYTINVVNKKFPGIKRSMNREFRSLDNNSRGNTEQHSWVKVVENWTFPLF